MDTNGILRGVRRILLIDWPSRDVPDSLVRAGFEVSVHGGPGPEDYSVYENVNGQIVARRTGRPPDSADLVYFYRPLTELPGAISAAKSLGAKGIWIQSGFSPEGSKDVRGCWLADDQKISATQQVQAAGLTLIMQPYIADAARCLH